MTQHDHMTPTEILAHAQTMLEAHGLDDDWKVTVSGRMIRSYGACLYQQREIRISSQLAALNPRSETIDTIAHEVAHALAGFEAGHGYLWRLACEQTGARPQQHCADDVVVPPARYDVLCDGCGQVVEQSNRRPKRPFYHKATRCLPGLERSKRELRWVAKLKH